MMHGSPHVERLTKAQIAHLQSLTFDAKWRGVAEINRRVRAEIEKVVRSEVPYFTDEQVHDTVCAMLLTKAMPECIDVRAIELEVIYGITPDCPVSRPESWIAERVSVGAAGTT
jgi:hypothetical protein